MIRKPAVAGQFYPGAKDALRKTVDGYLKSTIGPKKVLGLAAPHAGYVYSGGTAGHTFASAIIPKTCIILAPNHTGAGAKAAIMTDGEWVTPLGNVSVATDISKLLMSHSDLLKDDVMAHVAEHSLEVQLPFLQVLQSNLEIVPIALQHMSFADCEAIGKAIAETIRESGEEILIVASTDMNHYEDQEATQEKDQLAIDQVLSLNPEGLISTCSSHGITMCGAIPTTVMLVACLELGAAQSTLVEHTTSGDISGDYDAVVGYAGFLVY